MAEKHFGFCLSLSSAQGLLSESEAGGGVIYSQAGIILRADGVGKMCKEDEMWINLKMLSRMLGEFTLI